MRARLQVAAAALDRLEELAGEEWTNPDTIERVRGLYEFRRRRFKVQAGKIEDEDGIEDRSLLYQRLTHEIYTAQRAALVAVRDRGASGRPTSSAGSSASWIWRSRGWRFN